jgi:hypothetical protein
MDVHPSGYYAWRRQPGSDKVRDDQRLLGLLKQAWLESGCVYGYRKLTSDMRDLGERWASTVLPDCCAQKVSGHKLGTDAAQVDAAANLPWLHPII